MSTASESKTTRAKRPKRIPIGTRSPLATEQRDGYKRRWVNDKDHRINMFRDAGYSFVAKPGENISDTRAQDPSAFGDSVVRKPVGGGVIAYLMEIPLEYYQEDQLAKQKYIDEIEESYDPTRRIARTSYGNVFKKT